jgi:hypothetical protein
MDYVNQSNSKVLDIEFDGNDTWRITTVNAGTSSIPVNCLRVSFVFLISKISLKGILVFLNISMLNL